MIFHDALVLLGTHGTNQTEKPLRLVGYSAGGSDYWVATDCHDLTAEQIVLIYKLRWNIENLFAWWKRHIR
ncbi:MAG: transposase [Magnetococcales bacterium]|nr:transposase [Magnetococcales bacterium]